MQDDTTHVMPARQTMGRSHDPTRAGRARRLVPGEESVGKTAACAPLDPVDLAELAQPVIRAAQRLTEPDFRCVSVSTLRDQIARHLQHFEHACLHRNLDRFTVRFAQRLLSCWLQQAGYASKLADCLDGRKWLAELAVSESDQAELMASLDLLLLQPQRRPACLALARDCLAKGFSLARLCEGGPEDRDWQARLTAALAPPVLPLAAIAEPLAAITNGISAPIPANTAPTASPEPQSSVRVRRRVGWLLLILCLCIAIPWWRTWQVEQQITARLVLWQAQGHQLPQLPQPLFLHYQNLRQWQLPQTFLTPWLTQWGFATDPWKQRVASLLQTWSRERLIPAVTQAVAEQRHDSGAEPVAAWRVAMDYRALSGALTIAPELAQAGLSRLLADELIPPADWQAWLREYWRDEHWPELTPAIWEPLQARLEGVSDAALVLALLESLAVVLETAGDTLPFRWLQAEEAAISPLYTGAGFSRVYWPMRDRWLQYVLTARQQNADSDVAARLAALDASYWRSYRRHWRELPDRVRWQTARNLSEWLTQLHEWRANDGILAQLGDWEASLHVVGAEPLQEHPDISSSTSQWDTSVQDAAATLAAAMQAISAAPQPDQSALAWLRAEWMGVADAEYHGLPFTQLVALSETGPEPAASWLQAWLADGWHFLVQRAAGALAEHYQQTVYAFYHTHLASCFPVLPSAATDCSPASVNAFFAQDGLLARFERDWIMPFQRASRLAALNPVALQTELRLPVRTPESEQILAHWRAQSHAMSAPLLLSLTPQRLDAAVRRVLIRQGERTYPLQHGLHDPASLAWSPLRAADPIAIQFEDYFGAVSERQFTGPWAVLRLFRRFPLVPLEPHGWQWQVTLGDHHASYRISDASARWVHAWQSLAAVRLSPPAAWLPIACDGCNGVAD